MFFSFDPLVSLLNGLQVLKMQLHQPINLERVKAGRRRGRGSGGEEEETWFEMGEKKKEKTTARANERRLRKSNFLFCALIIEQLSSGVCCQLFYSSDEVYRAKRIGTYRWNPTLSRRRRFFLKGKKKKNWAELVVKSSFYCMTVCVWNLFTRNIKIAQSRANGWLGDRNMNLSRSNLLLANW